MENTKKIFFPNLDGLRFVAFFLVFVNHAVNNLGYKSTNPKVELFRYKYLLNGDLGVSFFFVLSGFLITYLLLTEKEQFAKISIRNFYIRRALRIIPLYYLIILLSLYLVPWIVQGESIPLKASTQKLDPLFYYLFAGNFDFFYNGISNVVIGVLWSVSVEEQFYLLAPFIVAFLPSKHLWKFFVFVIISALCYRLFLSGGKGVLIKFHTLSCMADLAMGALIAILFKNETFLNKFKGMSRKYIVLIYAVGMTLFLFRFNIGMIDTGKIIFQSFIPFLFTLFFAFIIAEQNFAERSFYKIGRWKWLSFLGRYTYGMYCYHMILFAVCMTIASKIGVDVLHPDKYYLIIMSFSILILTIIASILSYHFIEEKFLRLKDRFISE
ncbi:MAG: acyltransferase [Bacteroidetes bacterium]|nr:acyltransferase [Bacteroidota bacterium]